jgi:hypothetical protein
MGKHKWTGKPLKCQFCYALFLKGDFFVNCRAREKRTSNWWKVLDLFQRKRD